MRKRIRIATAFLCVAMMVMLLGSVTFAAGGSVTLSGGSAEVGKTVTVSGTVKCSKGAIGAATVTLTYDPSGLKFISGSAGTNGGSGSVVYSGYGDGAVKSLSFSLKFKVLKEGNYSISGIADAYNFDEQQLTMKVSSAVVKGIVVEEEPEKPEEPKPEEPEEPKPNKKSNNTKLTSLKVYPGTLSPAFSTDVRKYTMEVEEEVEDITISAVTQHAKATFYVSGNKGLKNGENTIKVVVTAEDGKTGSYTIVVNKGKAKQDLTIVNVGDKAYTINESFDAKMIPDGFVTTKIWYAKRAYKGVKLSEGTMTLLNLKDEEGKQAFFVYESNTKTLYPFVRIDISNKQQIVLLPLDLTTDAPSGMEKTTITLEGYQWDVWGDSSENYFVVNAQTLDGKEQLYRYDLQDGTYQRLITEPVEEEKTVVNEIDSIFPDAVAQYSDYIIIAAGGVILILLVVLVAVSANAEKRRRRRREKIERWKDRIH